MSEAGLEIDVATSQGDLSIEAAFTVTSGITVLFGPSGAGKSTVLDMIAGLRAPSRGRIALADRVLFDSRGNTNTPTRARRIGYVLQSLALFPHRDVWSNVVFGAHANHRVAKSLLEALGLGSMQQRDVTSLSGGERQRVALVRALADEPRALLLDEPLAALDRGRRADAISLLRETIRARAIPALWVTHDQEEAEAVGDAMVQLERGRVVRTGTPVEVLEQAVTWGSIALAAHDNRIEGFVVRARDDARDGETVFRAGEITLHARPSSRADGERAEFVVRAADVTLMLDSPGRTSAGNVLEATVRRIEARGRAMIVTLDAGIELRAEVTRGAIDRLALREGTRAWALFKTRACFVR